MPISRKYSFDLCRMGANTPHRLNNQDPEAWYIHFKTGKSNLDLDYNGNRGTLQRCIDRVQEIIDKNE